MLCDKHTLADDRDCWRCRIAQLEAENDAWAEKWLTERTENAKLREALRMIETGNCDYPEQVARAALEEAINRGYEE